MEDVAQNPFRSNGYEGFRGYQELCDWLGEGETMVEVHGTRLRLSMKERGGRVRFCETYTPPNLPHWRILVNIVAQCYFDLHKQDFEIT